VYLIEGAGQPGTAGELWGGTILKYTGSDNAINDLTNVAANQNWIGCQIRDLTIDGSTATGSANGFVFGGVDHAQLWNVSINKFPGAGIVIENGSNNMFTERYDLQGALWENNIGINAVANPGSQSSMGHSYIREWFNVPNSGRGIQMTGPASFYSTSIFIDGNIGGDSTTTGTPTMWWLNGGASQSVAPHVLPGPIYENEECNATSCVNYNIGANAVFGTAVLRGQGGGPWGANVIASGATFELMPAMAEHWITGNIGDDATANQDGVFPDFVVAFNGGTGPQPPFMGRFMCTYNFFGCTSYPTYALYDRNTSAYVAGASLACPAGINDTAVNVPLATGHTYTVRATTAAVGCPTTSPAASFFQVSLGGNW
jgi:hypothetical protein